MARLKIRLRGKVLNELDLEDGREYIGGRKDDADILLDAEKGISREHFKLFSDNGNWNLELLSRYGELSMAGEKVQTATLDHGQIFSIAPYEFEFLMGSPEQDAPAQTATEEPSENFDVGEKTVVGSAPSVPYVKVLDVHGEAKELFRLEGGDTWIAGREDSCDIAIRDQRVSRRQFEIRKVNAQYFILDTGSANGTLLNGAPISTTEPTPIRSGDSINVLDNNLSFELHDPNFKSRMELVNLQPLTPLAPLSQDFGSDQMVPYQQPMSYPVPQQPSYPAPLPSDGAAYQPEGFDFKKHRIKLVAGAILLLAVAFQMSEDTAPPRPTSGQQQAGGDPFLKLKPEQQLLIKQSYQLAKNLYMQGKYELSQNEINKILEIIPDYEDIKEIQRLSREAIFIQDQKRHQEEIEKAKAEAEEKILAKAIECDKKINPNITMDEMDACVSDVMQFNPDHPKILELRAKVEKIMSDREVKSAERAVHSEQVSKLKQLYAQAQAVEKSGKNLEAIKAYQVVKASRLPDPQGLRKESEKNIKNIRDMMSSRTVSLQAEAEKAEQAGNLKTAVVALRKARQIDPENASFQPRINNMVLELRKQMMILYQEGILEESFGNVDGSESKAGAKDKWKKILEMDVSDGEYYKKAYIKLKKYGAF